MNSSGSIDGSRRIDWGSTSADYAEWRPDYPDEFYDRLAARGIGVPGQRILDLGTGVGFLATRFAVQGAVVTGVDVAAGQIAEAKRRAGELGVCVDFRVAPAEATELPSASFDLITASQCWMYFDGERMRREVTRLLKPGGDLLITFFSYLPREDTTARATEQLIREHNRDWTGADWVGVTPDPARWGFAEYERVWEFAFDMDVPFTRESWRGRIRACRGVGASMSPEEVEHFDRKHAQLLDGIVPWEFTVRHRIEAFLLRPPR